MDLRFVNKEEAIKILKNYTPEYVLMTTINYIDNILYSGAATISKQKGNELIKEAVSVVLNKEDIYSQLDLHSIHQANIYDLKKEGVIKSLLLFP